MDMAARLLTELKHTFTSQWDVQVTAHCHITMTPKHRFPPSNPRRPRTTVDVLNRMSAYYACFERPGSNALLPLALNRDTVLTISAVQALDPYLKHAADHVWAEGFIAQPCVRFTGRRDETGHLVNGYATSFINASYIQRLPDITTFAALMDLWIGALSAAGIHAARMQISGRLTPWQRGSVSGLTLFITADGRGLGDAVLLWDKQERLAADFGTGIERLRWILNGSTWHQAVFNQDLTPELFAIKDALRAAVLLVLGGVRPAARGPGFHLRRLIRHIPSSIAAFGLSRAVRDSCAYWEQVGLRSLAWPHITQILEDAITESVPIGEAR